MIYSPHRDRKAKAIAEVLVMIADAHPVLPHHPHSARESEEWLWESATEFCAALDRYAERAMQIKRENHYVFSAHALRRAALSSLQRTAAARV
jgi:hypothetical protein